MNRKFLFFIGILCLARSSAFALDQINVPFNRPPNAPYFLGQPEMNIDAEEFNTVILRIRSAGSGTARLYWATNFDPKMNVPKSLWFFIDRSSDFKDYVFNIPAQNPNWAGFVGQLLVYPDSGPDGIELGPAQALPGNIFTNIRSAWREFWGPNGRVVIGSTINLIPSSSVFGRSINIYCYWLTGIFFIAAFLYFLFKTQKKRKKESQFDLQAAFKRTATATICLALSLWVLLALNADLNYYRIFETNFVKYFGRPIAEKRMASYGKAYYDFLLFAKENLPKEAVNFSVVSSLYAPDLTARIFLVPHVYVRQTDKDLQYLLVFHPAPDQKIDANFTPYAKFKDGEYILKRGK